MSNHPHFPHDGPPERRGGRGPRSMLHYGQHHDPRPHYQQGPPHGIYGPPPSQFGSPTYGPGSGGPINPNYPPDMGDFEPMPPRNRRFDSGNDGAIPAGRERMDRFNDRDRMMENREPKPFMDRQFSNERHEREFDFAVRDSGGYGGQSQPSQSPSGYNAGPPGPPRGDRRWGAAQTWNQPASSIPYDGPPPPPPRPNPITTASSPSGFTIREMSSEASPSQQPRERMWERRHPPPPQSDMMAYEPHSPPSSMMHGPSSQHGHHSSPYHPIRPIDHRENVRPHPYRRPMSMMHDSAPGPYQRRPFRQRSRSISPSRSPTPQHSRDSSPARYDAMGERISPCMGERMSPRIKSHSPSRISTHSLDRERERERQSSVSSMHPQPLSQLTPQPNPTAAPQPPPTDSQPLPLHRTSPPAQSYTLHSQSAATPTAPPPRRQLTVKRKNQKTPSPQSPTRSLSPGLLISPAHAGQPCVPPPRRSASPTASASTTRSSSPTNTGEEEGEIRSEDPEPVKMIQHTRHEITLRRPQFTTNHNRPSVTVQTASNTPSPSSSSPTTVRAFPSPMAPIRGVSQSSIVSVASGVDEEMKQASIEIPPVPERAESVVPLPVTPSLPSSTQLASAFSSNSAMLEAPTEPINTIDTVAKTEHTESTFDGPVHIQQQLLVPERELKERSTSTPMKEHPVTEHSQPRAAQSQPAVFAQTEGAASKPGSEERKHTFAPTQSTTPGTSSILPSLLRSSSVNSVLGPSFALMPTLTAPMSAALPTCPAGAATGAAKKRRVGFGMGLATLEKKKAPTICEEKMAENTEPPAGEKREAEAENDAESKNDGDSSMPSLLRSATAPEPDRRSPQPGSRGLSVAIPQAGTAASQSVVATPMDATTPFGSPSVFASSSAPSQRHVSVTMTTSPHQQPQSSPPTSPLAQSEDEEEKLIADAVAAIPAHLLSMSKHSLLAAIQKLDEQINDGEDERDKLMDTMRELQLKQVTIQQRLERGLSATKSDTEDDNDTEANDWEVDYEALEREERAKLEAERRVKEKEIEARLRDEWNSFENFHLQDPIDANLSLMQKIYAANRIRAARADQTFARLDSAELTRLPMKFDHWKQEPNNDTVSLNDMAVFFDRTKRFSDNPPLYPVISEAAVFRENLHTMPVNRAQITAVLARRKRNTGEKVRRLLTQYQELNRRYQLEESQREASKKFQPPLPRISRMHASILDPATQALYHSYGSNTDSEPSQREIEAKRQRWERGACAIPTMILDPSDLRYSRFVSHNGFIEDPRESERQYKLSNPWTDKEKQIFEAKYLKFPKQFRKIALYLPNKNVNDCVAYYYYSKLQINYKELLRTQQKKAKQRKKKINDDIDDTDEPQDNEEEEDSNVRKGGRTRVGGGRRSAGAAAGRPRGISRELIGLAIDLSNITPTNAAQTTASASLTVPAALVDNDEEMDAEYADDSAQPRSRKRGRATRGSVDFEGSTDFGDDANDEDDGSNDNNDNHSDSDDGEEELQHSNHSSIPNSPIKGGGRRRRASRGNAGSANAVDSRPFWTEQERALFLEALDAHGKNFSEIATHVGSKSVDKCIDINTEVLMRVSGADGGADVRWMDCAEVVRQWEFGPMHRSRLYVASLHTDQQREAENGLSAGSLDRLVYEPLIGVVRPFKFNERYTQEQHPVRIRALAGRHGAAVDLLLTPDHNVWAAPQSLSVERQMVSQKRGEQVRAKSVIHWTTYPYRLVPADRLGIDNPLHGIATGRRDATDSQFQGWKIKTAAPIDAADFSFTLPSMRELLDCAAAHQDHAVRARAASLPQKYSRRADSNEFAAFTFSGEHMDALLGVLGIHLANGNVASGSSNFRLVCTLKHHPRFVSQGWRRLRRIRRQRSDGGQGQRLLRRPFGKNKVRTYADEKELEIQRDSDCDTNSDSDSDADSDIDEDIHAANSSNSTDSDDKREESKRQDDNCDCCDDNDSMMSQFCWTVPQLVLWLIITELHTSEQKMYVPFPVWVWSLSSRQVRLLLLGIMHGDGMHRTQRADCSWCGMRHLSWGHIVTTSKSHADELQALAMHAGLVSSISSSSRDTSHLVNNLTQRHETGLYTVYIYEREDTGCRTHTRAFSRVGCKQETWERKQMHSQYINNDDRPETRERAFWCVTTAAPSSVILVRRLVNDYEHDPDSIFSNPIAKNSLRHRRFNEGDKYITAFVGNCKNYWNNNKAKLKLEERLQERLKKLSGDEKGGSTIPPVSDDGDSEDGEDGDIQPDKLTKRARVSGSGFGSRPGDVAESPSLGSSNSRAAVVHWTAVEKEALMQAVSIYGRDWNALAAAVPTRTLKQIKTWWQNNMQRLGLKEMAQNAMHGTRQSDSNITSPAMMGTKSASTTPSQLAVLATPALFTSPFANLTSAAAAAAHELMHDAIIPALHVEAPAAADPMIDITDATIAAPVISEPVVTEAPLMASSIISSMQAFNTLAAPAISVTAATITAAVLPLPVNDSTNDVEMTTNDDNASVMAQPPTVIEDITGMSTENDEDLNIDQASVIVHVEQPSELGNEAEHPTTATNSGNEADAASHLPALPVVDDSVEASQEVDKSIFAPASVSDKPAAAVVEEPAAALSIEPPLVPSIDDAASNTAEFTLSHSLSVASTVIPAPVELAHTNPEFVFSRPLPMLPSSISELLSSTPVVSTCTLQESFTEPLVPFVPLSSSLSTVGEVPAPLSTPSTPPLSNVATPSHVREIENTMLLPPMGAVALTSPASSPGLLGHAEGLLSSSPSPSVSSIQPAPPSPEPRELLPSSRNPEQPLSPTSMSRHLSTFSPLSHLAHHPLSPSPPSPEPESASGKSSPVSSSPPSPTPSILSFQSIASPSISIRATTDSSPTPVNEYSKPRERRTVSEVNEVQEEANVVGNTAMAIEREPVVPGTGEMKMDMEEESESKVADEPPSPVMSFDPTPAPISIALAASVGGVEDSLLAVDDVDDEDMRDDASLMTAISAIAQRPPSNPTSPVASASIATMETQRNILASIQSSVSSVSVDAEGNEAAPMVMPDDEAESASISISMQEPTDHFSLADPSESLPIPADDPLLSLSTMASPSQSVAAPPSPVQSLLQDIEESALLPPSSPSRSPSLSPLPSSVPPPSTPTITEPVAQPHIQAVGSFHTIELQHADIHLPSADSEGTASNVIDDGTLAMEAETVEVQPITSASEPLAALEGAPSASVVESTTPATLSTDHQQHPQQHESLSTVADNTRTGVYTDSNDAS